MNGLRRFWLTARHLGVLGRFLTGKASFVEADVRATTRGLSEVLEASGERRGPELLAHFQLATRRPRTGTTGWELFLERVAAGSPHGTVRLDCGWCGHLFFIQILRQAAEGPSALDPLASEAAGGRAPGRPASYSAEWFRFMHEDFQGEPSLNCPHCEQRGAPRVARL